MNWSDDEQIIRYHMRYQFFKIDPRSVEIACEAFARRLVHYALEMSFGEREFKIQYLEWAREHGVIGAGLVRKAKRHVEVAIELEHQVAVGGPRDRRRGVHVDDKLPADRGQES